MRFTMSAMSTARSEVMSIFEKLGYSVKSEQLEVITGILRRDVFVVLPTGFGKSLCFLPHPPITEGRGSATLDYVCSAFMGNAP